MVRQPTRPPRVGVTKRRRLASREDTVVTSLIIPRPLHKRAMISALGLNWAFAEVVRTALAEWLDRHEATRRRVGR